MDITSLVKRAKKGDDGAFYQLMQHEKIRLYRMALSYLKNNEDAIEALQEVTYRAYRSIQKLKEPAYFSTWITRILLNYCHDETVKKKRIVVSDELIQFMGATRESSFIEIEDALERLDDRTRQVITLKYLHDLKIKEIAEVLECPEGTIKTWLNKGLKELRDELGGNGGFEHV